MVESDQRYEQLIALPAWGAYSTSPGPRALGDLLNAASGVGLRDRLPLALARLFASSRNWRVAQHLANEFMDEHRDTTLAEYYAAKAVELSGGDLVARLSLARCLCLQRFPEAVLGELSTIEPLLETYEPAERRPVFQHEVADLYVNTYCYANRLDLARPWVDQLLQSGHLVRGETLIQLLTSAFHHDVTDLAVRAARILAPKCEQLSTLEQKQVTVVLQVNFIRTLLARP